MCCVMHELIKISEKLCFAGERNHRGSRYIHINKPNPMIHRIKYSDKMTKLNNRHLNDFLVFLCITLMAM